MCKKNFETISKKQINTQKQAENDISTNFSLVYQKMHRLIYSTNIMLSKMRIGGYTVQQKQSKDQKLIQ